MGTPTPMRVDLLVGLSRKVNEPCKDMDVINKKEVPSCLFYGGLGGQVTTIGFIDGRGKIHDY